MQMITHNLDFLNIQAVFLDEAIQMLDRRVIAPVAIGLLGLQRTGNPAISEQRAERAAHHVSLRCEYLGRLDRLRYNNEKCWFDKGTWHARAGGCQTSTGLIYGKGWTPAQTETAADMLLWFTVPPRTSQATTSCRQRQR